MPVPRIFSRFASAELELEGQKHIAVVPVIRNLCILKRISQQFQQLPLVSLVARSVRKLYGVLIKREDFNGCELNENANSDNNRGIMDSVIEQVLHEYGGQERCPWSRAIMQEKNDSNKYM
ncbi:hypothetical protein P5673_023189 [Acropora cervicornis]|uniref:Uncharacterized protein n=1 Tax=Acropora cervicornis TaxID=6130 RepID=A0AAD9UZ38_ACRCE|nr:hypothetical protein P5673_023189 [Acropora cervicornis]